MALSLNREEITHADHEQIPNNERNIGIPINILKSHREAELVEKSEPMCNGERQTIPG